MKAADAQCCHPLPREGKRVQLSGPENTWSHVLPKGNAAKLTSVPMRSGFQITVSVCRPLLKARQDLAMVHHFAAELFGLGVPGFSARLFDPAFELRNQVLQNSRVLLVQITHDAVLSIASPGEGCRTGTMQCWEKVRKISHCSRQAGEIVQRTGRARCGDELL
jgi:hypothetical protein